MALSIGDWCFFLCFCVFLCCWPWLRSVGRVIMNKFRQRNKENTQVFNNTLEQKLIIAQEISKKDYVVNRYSYISFDLKEKYWQKIYENITAKGVIVKSCEHLEEIWEEMKFKATIHRQKKKMNELDRFIVKMLEDHRKQFRENLALDLII